MRLRSDEAPRRALRRKRLRRLSAFGLVLYVLSVTFAAIDWMMSLEPLWFSAIYGVIVIAGQAAVAFAVVICVLVWLRGDQRVEATASTQILQDLGNLLLAAVTFWMYIAFSQFLIIWAGNLTEEIPWYLARSRGGWQWLAVALVLLHFVVPFVALLSPVVKRGAGYLASIAVLVSLMHVADVYWLVMPALRASLFVHWLDVVALVTLGAIWKAVTAWRLQTAPRFPAEVPQRGLEHGKLTALHQPG